MIKNYDKSDSTNILNKINSDSLYFYWSDKIEINKLITVKNNLNYLPVYPYSFVEYDQLIDSDILIFFKNPKIIYGSFKIKSIIIKNIKKKNYFDHNQDQDQESNPNIKIDEKLFSDLIKKYNINEIPNLFFIQIINFKIFEYEVSVKGLNDYFLIKSLNNYVKFKYPTKVQDIHIIKNNYPKIVENIIEYIEFIEKNIKNNNLTLDNISFKSIDIEELNSKNKNTSSITNSEKINNFNIPIVWKICSELAINIENSCIKKNIFLNHWTKCEQCEKTDNNLIECELGKNKIKFNIIDDKNIINNIINSYQNVKKYHIDNNQDQISSDRTNIIYSPNSSNIYSKCLFVIE